MQGRVDTSFQTVQRDLFSSGLAAQIGMNAFGIWIAIKSHADYQTGRAWPGMRRLAELTGLSLGTVSNSVQTLVDAKLLRVVVQAKGKSRRGNTYIARERLDVRLGERVLCTIVLDYVPAQLRGQVGRIDQALRTGETDAEVFAECEVLPGPGFTWSAETGSMRASIPAREIPAVDQLSKEEIESPLVQRVLAIAKRGSKHRVK
jgi:hypothetical protein